MKIAIVATTAPWQDGDAIFATLSQYKTDKNVFQTGTSTVANTLFAFLAYLPNRFISWLPVILMVLAGGLVCWGLVRFLGRKIPRVALWIGLLWLCYVAYELVAFTVATMRSSICPGETCWMSAYGYIVALLQFSAASYLLSESRRILKGDDWH